MSNKRATQGARPAGRLGSIVTIVVVVLVLLGLLASSLAGAAEVPKRFRDRSIGDVGSFATAMARFDGDLLVATLGGRLYRVNLGKGKNAGKVDEVLDLSATTCSGSEQGLLGVAVDPNVGQNGTIYLYRTVSLGGQTCVNRVSRFTFAGADVAASSEVPIVDNIQSSSPSDTSENHNAGDLEFGGDGFLYVSTGDAATQGGELAQSLSSLNGKILRVDRDGNGPGSNPFAGGVDCGASGSGGGQPCREIYATGLRNPFRFAFNPNGGKAGFYINDVGQNTFDEIDLGRAGANYGWPEREGPCPQGQGGNCAPPTGSDPPIHAYNHNTGCRSITGGAFVPNGTDWGKKRFGGGYLFGDFVCDTIFLLRPNNGTLSRSTFATNASGVIDLLFSPNGKTLYYTTADGEVRAISKEAKGKGNGKGGKGGKGDGNGGNGKGKGKR